MEKGTHEGGHRKQEELLNSKANQLEAFCGRQEGRSEEFKKAASEEEKPRRYHIPFPIYAACLAMLSHKILHFKRSVPTEVDLSMRAQNIVNLRNVWYAVAMAGRYG